MHDEVGYNYRLPNINAALGCAQLEQLPGFIERKRALAERYRDGFAGVAGRALLRANRPARRATTGSTRSLLDAEHAAVRDDLLEALQRRRHHGAAGLDADAPAADVPDCPRMDLAVAEDIEARLDQHPEQRRPGRRAVAERRICVVTGSRADTACCTG